MAEKDGVVDPTTDGVFDERVVESAVMIPLSLRFSITASVICATSAGVT